MGVAQAGEQAQAAVLPLAVQNAYRDRYRTIRPDWRSSGEVFDAMVAAHVTPDSRVLDLGCGRGGVVERFWREVRLAVGIDSDAPSLTEHRTAGMPVIQALGETLPFADEAFDLVVCVWVLEHLADPAAALSEVRRVLRPGGHFVFLTPNLRNPVMWLNRLGQALPAVQRNLVAKVYGRAETDTFLVRYRANTRGALRGHARAAGLVVEELRVVPDPTYLALNGFLFRMSVLSERLMPRTWGVHLVGDLAKT
jgi:SAM-dependent methyltransferase